VTDDRKDNAVLEERLRQLWRDIRDGSGTHTSVVVPSLSFPAEELVKIAGAPFYEERLLFCLMRLRDPRARVLYITSQPIHPQIVDYYLQLLVGVPTSHARERLGMLCVYDATPRPLTEKLLERPRVIERIRRWIGDTDRAYLTCFTTSPLELELSHRLDVPLNGAHPDDLWMGTKSGSRKVFKEAGVRTARGREDVFTRDEVLETLDALHREQPIRRAVVKLDDSFAGAGNGLFRYPDPMPEAPEERRRALQDALQEIDWTARGESWAGFEKKLATMGGVVEEFMEAREVHSPSVQMRVNPLGETSLVSTHDQVLGGTTGQVYEGCRFPANDDYRALIQTEAWKIAKILADRGVHSRFAIDFLVFRDAETEPWQLIAIEINLRMGGTTPPFLALQFLTGGDVDPETGHFRSGNGNQKFYRATDSLLSPDYRGLLPEDLIDILINHDLHYRPSTETGVLFHMIGALSEHGKVGVTCIGDSPEEAEKLFERTAEILDLETGEGGEVGESEYRSTAPAPIE
jgi:hypothetical protein